MNILITGCTGFIGGGVLARIIDNPKYKKIYVLLRGSDDQTPQKRLIELTQDLIPPYKQALTQSKIKAIAGDLSQPGLALSDEDRRELVKNIHQVVHIAASTKFAAPMDELRQFNVLGTKRLLDIAKEARANGQFERFDFVSTAYTAGNKPGIIIESDLARGQGFSNNYEQSKFETEQLVHSYMGDFPITIMRPSIVVGQSNNGYTPHFRVLYWPVKMIARGIVSVIPVNQKAHLDVVPADYVCDSVVALMQSPKAHNCTFLLTAGMGNELSIGKLLDDATSIGAAPWRPRIPVWMFRCVEHSPLRYLLPKKFWDMAEKAAPYTGYLLGTGVRYDNSKTMQLLTELGVKRPHWDQYFHNIFAYAVNSDWGRKADQPAHAFLSGDGAPVSLEAMRFKMNAKAQARLAKAKG